MTREEYLSLPREEIVEICKSLNINAHHKSKTETLVDKILSQPKAYQEDALKHPAERAKHEEEHNNTKEQVLEAIKHYSNKQGFEVSFPDEQSWAFSYRQKEDTGSLKIPLRVIVMRAEMVAQGAKLPPMDSDRNGKFMWAAR